MKNIINNSAISESLGYSRSYYRGDNLPELQPLIQPLIDAAAEFDLLAFCHRLHPHIWQPNYVNGGLMVAQSVNFEDKVCKLSFMQVDGINSVRLIIKTDYTTEDYSKYYKRYLIARGIICEVSRTVRTLLANEVELSYLLPEIKERFKSSCKMELWRSPNGVHLQVIRNGNPAENIIGGYVVRNNPDFEKVTEVNSYYQFLNLIK